MVKTIPPASANLGLSPPIPAGTSAECQEQKACRERSAFADGGTSRACRRGRHSGSPTHHVQTREPEQQDGARQMGPVANQKHRAQSAQTQQSRCFASILERV